MADQNGEVEAIKGKLAGIGEEKSGFRSENEKLKLTISKMTYKLVKLEKDDKRKKQYEAIQKKIHTSIKTEDREKYTADLANLRDIESSPVKHQHSKEKHSPPKKDKDSSDKKSKRSKSSSSSSSSSSGGSDKSKKKHKKDKPVVIKKESHFNDEPGRDPMIQNVSDRDYVAATLNAWNACPSIVKKQLDEQFSEIAELKSKVREGELKL